MAQRVSIGQAAANAIAAFLQQQLNSDIVVMSRWPTTKDLPSKVVTIIKYGRRSRMDEEGAFTLSANVLQQVTPSTSMVSFAFQGLVQPIQLDVWAKNDPDRDDIIAQLDDAFYAGLGDTLGIQGADPVREGILLAMGDGFSGFVDVNLDEPEISDTPETVARREYRATYLGEAVMVFQTAPKTVPLIKSATLSLTNGTQPIPVPNGTQADTTTVTPQGVTHGHTP